MLSLVVADDHPLLLEGLVNHLIDSGYTDICKALNGQEAYRLIKEKDPDIAILDIEMPFIDGLSIARQCGTEHLKTKFIILTYHREPEFILKAKSVNISGYILKEDAISEIGKCLEAVASNQEYYSKVFRSQEVSQAESTLERLQTLSPSELKILKLIAENLSSTEISNQLFVSERTIEKHRSNIIAKLQLKSKPTILQEWVAENKVFL